MASTKLPENPAHTEALTRFKTALDEGTITEEEYRAVRSWEERLHEARTYLMSLAVEVENYGMGQFFQAVIIAQWALLRQRDLRPTIHDGYMSYEKPEDASGTEPAPPKFVVPTMWIEVPQPDHERAILERIWGAEDVRAAPTLMVDIGGVLSALREGTILGQIMQPVRSNNIPIRYWREKVAPFPEKRVEICEAQSRNWKFVAAHPARYFKFGMPTMIRDQLLKVMRHVEHGDPTTVQYIGNRTEKTDADSKEAPRPDAVDTAQPAGSDRTA